MTSPVPTNYIAIHVVGRHPIGVAWRNRPTWKYKPLDDPGAPRWYHVGAWLLSPLLWWPAMALQRVSGKPVAVWCYNGPKRRFKLVTFGGIYARY